MSGSRTKLRAILLAFVMVTSALAAGAAFSGSAAAQQSSNFDSTIYVDATSSASGNGDGTQSSPYESLQVAIDDAGGDSGLGGGSGDQASTSDDTLILLQNGTTGAASQNTGEYTDLTIDADRSGDLVIAAENGTGAVTLNDDDSGDLVDISSSVNATFENITLQGHDSNRIIDARTMGTDSTLTVQNSDLSYDSTNGNSYAIESQTQILVENNEIYADDSGNAWAVRTDNAAVDDSVIRNNNIHDVNVGVQTTNANNVTISGNDFDTLDASGVFAIAGSTTISEYTVTENNFTNIGAITVDFQANDDGSAVIDNSSVGDEALYVARNNFFDGAGGPQAIDLSQTGAGTIPGTIFAEENYYGTAAGPDDGTTSRDMSNYATKGATVDTDVPGDLVFGPWLDAPYPNNDETLDFDTSFAVDQQNADDLTRVNVTIPAAGGHDVNESSIDLRLDNTVSGQSFRLVDGGQLQTSAVPTVNTAQSTLDGTNESVEFIKLNVSLQEAESADDYDLIYNATQTDSGDTQIANDPDDDVTTLTAGDASVDNTGSQFNIVADSANPFAEDGQGAIQNDEGADVQVTIADQYGFNLTDATEDADVGTDVDAFDSSVVASTGDNSATVNGIYQDQDGDSGSGTQTAAPIDNNPAFINVSNTEAETVNVEISDVTGIGNNLDEASVSQTFSAQIGGVNISANRTSLPSDDTQLQLSAQLTDGNGNTVPRKGVDVAYRISNSSSSNAGISRVDGSGPYTTNSNGVATLNITASNAGYSIDAEAIERGSGSGYSDITTFNTVSGEIDNAQSSLTLNSGGDVPKSDGVQVATDHYLKVSLVDGNGNAAPNIPVTFTSNNSGTSFDAASGTTNSSGEYATTVTLPQQKGSVALNVSASGFNASASGNAQVNVTSNAANISTLRFASDQQTTFAADSGSNTVTIEAADQYGNLNDTDSGTVTLESGDTDVFDFGGSASDTADFSSGTATLSNLKAGSSAGQTTISATIPDSNIQNTTTTFTVGEPTGINVTFTSAVSTSSNSKTNGTATLQAQLTSSGNNIGVENENVSFARTSGSAAELNQSRQEFVAETNANGLATFQVNATSSTGQTTFLAQSENFSASGSGTITTTGAANTINVATENSSVAQNETTNVTVSFVDSQGRIVPRLDNIGVSADNGTIEDPTNPKTSFNSAGEATASTTYNATGGAGEATIQGLGGGVAGSTTITVEEATDGGSNTTNFVVSNVSPDGANVTQGQTVDVTADIENTGGADGTQTVGFRLDTNGDGQLDASEELVNQSVQRDAGENSSVTFSVDTSVLPNETATYDHGVFSQNDSDTATITVEEGSTAISALIQIDLTADRGVQTPKISFFSEHHQSAAYTRLPRNVYSYTRTHTGGLR